MLCFEFEFRNVFRKLIMFSNGIFHAITHRKLKLAASAAAAAAALKFGVLAKKRKVAGKKKNFQKKRKLFLLFTNARAHFIKCT
jgi:hypothetical protein